MIAFLVILLVAVTRAKLFYWFSKMYGYVLLAEMNPQNRFRPMKRRHYRLDPCIDFQHRNRPHPPILRLVAGFVDF
jgi:hypothetical protein